MPHVEGIDEPFTPDSQTLIDSLVVELVHTSEDGEFTYAIVTEGETLRFT